LIDSSRLEITPNLPCIMCAAVTGYTYKWLVEGTEYEGQSVTVQVTTVGDQDIKLAELDENLQPVSLQDSLSLRPA
jgi:hypothetical protein